MDAKRFETVLVQLAQSRTRREAVRRLGAAALGLGGLSLLASSTDARRRKKRKGGKRGKRGKGGKGGGGGGLELREICEPGTDVCAGNLECDSPTTRHTCSSTVDGVEAWCCVPPGGKCTECDCCGDYYCAYDDDNNPTCQPIL